MVVGTPTSNILLLFRITALILGLTPKDFLIFIMVHLCTYIYILLIYIYTYIYTYLYINLLQVNLLYIYIYIFFFFSYEAK